MSRRVARELLFKLVFEFTFNKTFNENTLGLFLMDSTLDDEDKAYISDCYIAISEHFDELNSIIEKHSKGFLLSRIYRPDLAVLLVGIYEILYLPNVPYKVAINEAVNLAKSYGEDKSSKFVNGILASVLKEKEEI